MAARVLVFLIVSRRIPDVYLSLGGTHGHQQFQPHHWATAAMLAIAVSVFGFLLSDSRRYADRLLLRLQIVEQSQPPLR